MSLYGLFQSVRNGSKGTRGGETAPRLCAEALDEGAMTAAARYHQMLSNAAHAEDDVDDITWNDLDMNRIYMSMRYTYSTAGDEVLYDMLRNTGESAETLAARGDGVRAMASGSEELARTARVLSRLGRNPYHGACDYLFAPSGKRPGHIPLFIALAALPFVFVGLGFFRPAFFLGVAGMFLINLIVYYWSGKVWMKEIASIRHLAAVVQAATKLRGALPEALSGARAELKALCAEMKPVLRWNALFAMQRQNDFDFLTDYIRIMFQPDMLCLNKLTSFFIHHNDALRRIYRLVGEIDAWQAIAAYRAQVGTTCAPAFSAETRVIARGLAHPLIAEPVRNDFDWTRSTLVTGSNASGKSTFIKALAVNALLAQTVVTCTAESFSLPRARVMTSMALRDSLLNGESYFIVEIKSLKRILDALNPASLTLCFIDEILRGTNTRERIAASSSLLAYLTRQHCLCMAATHDIELTTLLSDYQQIHFTETLLPHGMTFSYKLREGPCRTRNAIALLKVLDFPREVTARADEIADAENSESDAL